MQDYGASEQLAAQLGLEELRSLCGQQSQQLGQNRDLEQCRQALVKQLQSEKKELESQMKQLRQNHQGLVRQAVLLLLSQKREEKRAEELEKMTHVGLEELEMMTQNLAALAMPVTLNAQSLAELAAWQEVVELAERAGRESLTPADLTPDLRRTG